MKVRRLWTCSCGEGVVLEPVGQSRQIISKGLFRLGPHEGPQWLVCSSCSDRYPSLHEPLVPRSVVGNKLRKVWECDHTKVLESETGELVIQGPGFRFGSPHTHIKCDICYYDYRLSPDVKLFDHMRIKQEKRTKSKKNRRARKNQRR